MGSEHYDQETGTYNQVHGDFSGIQAGPIVIGDDDDDDKRGLWIGGRKGSADMARNNDAIDAALDARSAAQKRLNADDYRGYDKSRDYDQQTITEAGEFLRLEGQT